MIARWKEHQPTSDSTSSGSGTLTTAAMWDRGLAPWTPGHPPNREAIRLRLMTRTATTNALCGTSSTNCSTKMTVQRDLSSAASWPAQLDELDRAFLVVQHPRLSKMLRHRLPDPSSLRQETEVDQRVVDAMHAIYYADLIAGTSRQDS